MKVEEFKNKINKTLMIIDKFEENKNIFLKNLKQRENIINNSGHKINLIVKIVTNGKVDKNHYEEKLQKILDKLKSLSSTKEIDETLINKVEKIKNNFEHLCMFMDEYSKIIINSNLNKEDIAHLKTLENQEMANSMKKLNETYVFLKKASFKDVLKKSTSKPAKQVIPTLDELFKNLYVSNDERYNLNTPFGIVNVQLQKRSYGIEFMIYDSSKKAWSYNDICLIDNLFSVNEPQKIVDNIILPIIQYLKVSKSIDINKIEQYFNSTKTYDNAKKNNTIQEIFNMFTVPLKKDLRSITFPDPKSSKKNIKLAAAALSGILILAESCQYRNPTFGKLEKNAMKTVLRLAQNGCTNPFSKVFNSQQARYIPAQKDGNLGTQELLGYNAENNSIQARFLPLPNFKSDSELATNNLKKLFCQENFLENLYRFLYPYKGFSQFLNEFTLTNNIISNDTIKMVFEKLNELFPNAGFGTGDDFLTLNNSDKRSKIRNITQYRSKTSKEEENVKKFVEYVEQKAYNHNLETRMQNIINNAKKEELKDLILKTFRIKKYSQCLTVTVYYYYNSNGSEYVNLDNLPKLSSEYLIPPASTSGKNLKEYMQDTINKGLKKLYKSQNQTFTNEQVKKLLDELKS